MVLDDMKDMALKEQFFNRVETTKETAHIFEALIGQHCDCWDPIINELRQHFKYLDKYQDIRDIVIHSLEFISYFPEVDNFSMEGMYQLASVWADSLYTFLMGVDNVLKEEENRGTN